LTTGNVSCRSCRMSTPIERRLYEGIR
jgi:hypothetical protein